MLKYAKVISEEIGNCEVGLGDDVNFYKSLGFTQLDVEQSEIDNDWYLSEKCPHKSDEEKLQERKEERLLENKKIRDAFLLDGVIYKEVAFDSDTDQKVNIMATVQTMSEEDVIDWYGKDGVTTLSCTKEDLLNIGNLITKMTSYVWQIRNPQIKLEIENAKTIEEVNAVDISYNKDFE